MFLTTLTFLFVLSVLVLVHEFGHFLAAKRAGIKIEEFGFGYPPKILAKKINETLYSLNAIPFGGFVRLYGEEPHFANLPAGKAGVTQDAFFAKSKKARTSVILAGVLANFILAIFCFSVVYSFSGVPVKTNQVKIFEIAKDSPAEKMGLKEGDVIIKIDEEKLNNLNYFTGVIKQKKGKQVKVEIIREKNNLIFFVTPRENPPEGEGPLGVAVSDVEIKKYPFWQMPARGVVEGFKEAFGWGMLIVNSLVLMISNLVSKGIIPREVAGPIGIFQATSNVARSGFLTVLQFMGVLSVNLAILNILPIPAFDGGRLIFIIYELFTRKKPAPAVEKVVNTIGMGLVIILIILVTLNDISRLLK